MSAAEVTRMRHKDILGRQGEQAAAEYLERAGFRILDRNYKCPGGEIDIVAADRRGLGAGGGKTRSDGRVGAPVGGGASGKLRRLRPPAGGLGVPARLAF